MGACQVTVVRQADEFDSPFCNEPEDEKRGLKPAKSSSKYPQHFSGYSILNRLESGSYGDVYRARVKNEDKTITKKEVAIKIIDLESTKDFEAIVQEVHLMANVRHPRIMYCHASFLKGSQLCIVMPLMDGGSIVKLMRTLHYGHGFTDEVILATMLRFVLEGLEYLHACGYIHRDVKGQNILVSTCGQVTLADLGNVMEVRPSKWPSKNESESGNAIERHLRFVGTPCWMAPEVANEVVHNPGLYEFTEAVDIYSFGILCLELACGRPPDYDKTVAEILYNRVTGPSPNPSVHLAKTARRNPLSSRFKDLINKCLRKDPSQRPSARTLLSHKFFARAKGESYLVQHLLQYFPLKMDKSGMDKSGMNSSLDIDVTPDIVLNVGSHIGSHIGSQKFSRFSWAPSYRTHGKHDSTVGEIKERIHASILSGQTDMRPVSGLSSRSRNSSTERDEMEIDERGIKSDRLLNTKFWGDNSVNNRSQTSSSKTREVSLMKLEKLEKNVESTNGMRTSGFSLFSESNVHSSPLSREPDE